MVAADHVHHAADGARPRSARLLQPRGLVADRRAAEHGHHVQALLLAVGAQRLGDLDAELAGRRQHDRLDVRVVRIDVLDHRQPERGRLAGARLRLADHVAALQQRAGSPAPGSAWGARSRGGVSVSSVGSESPSSAKVVISGVLTLCGRGRAAACRSCAAPAGPRGRGAHLGQRIACRRPAARSSPRAARAKRSASGSSIMSRRPRQCISQKPITARLLRIRRPVSSVFCSRLAMPYATIRPNGASASRHCVEDAPARHLEHHVHRLAARSPRAARP